MWAYYNAHGWPSTIDKEKLSEQHVEVLVIPKLQYLRTMNACLEGFRHAAGIVKQYHSVTRPHAVAMHEHVIQITEAELKRIA
jgi:hypothetical protein